MWGKNSAAESSAWSGVLPGSASLHCRRFPSRQQQDPGKHFINSCGTTWGAGRGCGMSGSAAFATDGLGKGAERQRSLWVLCKDGKAPNWQRLCQEDAARSWRCCRAISSSAKEPESNSHQWRVCCCPQNSSQHSVPAALPQFSPVSAPALPVPPSSSPWCFALAPFDHVLLLLLLPQKCSPPLPPLRNVAQDPVCSRCVVPARLPLAEVLAGSSVVPFLHSSLPKVSSSPSKLLLHAHSDHFPRFALPL